MVTFKRYAGSLQLEIRNFEDLRAALEVPKTQWVATACPVFGLNCDRQFLRHLDTDGNGRIRVEEFVSAVEWTASMLKDYKGVDEGSDTLVLARLSPEASGLREATKLVLEARSTADFVEITLDQVRASEKPLREAFFNGDGILAPESVKDTRLAAIVAHAVACVPETKNRSGKAGVTKEQLVELRERIAKAQAHESKRREVDVWGEASVARAEIVRAVRGRLDEYFRQCRLVAAHPSALEHLRLEHEKIVASLGDAVALERVLAAAPIATPNPEGVLQWSSLSRGPVYEALEKLRREVCDPVLGVKPTLSDSEWRALTASAEAIDAWRTAVSADKLVFERLADLSAVKPADFDAITALCEADLARKERLDAVAQLEKLILFQRWILRFANNFVSMPDLYDPGYTALFEQGRLILSGRLFTFSVRVADRASHAALAARGTMFIAYVKIMAKDDSETFEVAVPVTSGTAAGVEVGKRGIFTDPAGREWDAAVVQLVTNPVSLWEAVMAPYRKIGAFVSSKVESWAGEGDKTLEEQLNKGHAQVERTRGDIASGAASAGSPAPSAAAAPTAAESPATNQAGAGMGGNIAIAASIAITAVSAVIGTIVGVFSGKSLLQSIGMLLGIFVAVSLPAGVFGWLKLRKRDMAIVLEACGWALNDRMRLGKYLGALFTRKPARPRGARIDALDSVQSTIERRRAEGLDEIERTGLHPLAWVALVTLALAAAAIHWRHPLCTAGASRGWVRASRCEEAWFRAPETSSAPAAAPSAAH